MKQYRLKLPVLVVMVMLLLGFSGCGSSGDDEIVPAEDNTVVIQDFKYHPSEITIKSGETITWINKDSVKHDARNDIFGTGLLAKEESAQITFEEAGTFDYHCTPHPYMEGTVIVED